MQVSQCVGPLAMSLALNMIAIGNTDAQTRLPDSISSRGADTADSPFGLCEILITDGATVDSPHRQGLQRSAIPIGLSGLPEGVFIDVAELVLSVSTFYDTMFVDSISPLIVAAYPALESASDLSSRWSNDWTEDPEGYDPEILSIASINSTESDFEIRLEVTEFVRRWASGAMPNHGVVIRCLSEGRSTFQWTRDNRYGGAHATLRIWYSKPDNQRRVP
jgi:hypothetical protein